MTRLPRHLLNGFGVLFIILGSASSVILQIQIDTYAANTPASPPNTRTVVADLLMIDENFYIVRSERGEIRIEVTSDTKLAEPFQFGDRIKAVLLPNDKAISIVRAKPDEPVGITTQVAKPEAPRTPPVSGRPLPAQPSGKEGSPASPHKEPTLSPSPPTVPQIRIIVEDILMVDRNFYIVRTERGEIQIEITPETQTTETFKFGDRIKARVTPNDKALSIERALPHEPKGIRMEEARVAPQVPSSAMKAAPDQPEKKVLDGIPPPLAPGPKGRVIIADILMVDGDFYVVRGERGEIRIEITPETKLAEKFKFGDKIKAIVLPNDKALSVERAP